MFQAVSQLTLSLLYVVVVARVRGGRRRRRQGDAALGGLEQCRDGRHAIATRVSHADGRWDGRRRGLEARRDNGGLARKADSAVTVELGGGASADARAGSSGRVGLESGFWRFLRIAPDAVRGECQSRGRGQESRMLSQALRSLSRSVALELAGAELMRARCGRSRCWRSGDGVHSRETHGGRG